jgi:hypothetical protein
MDAFPDFIKFRNAPSSFSIEFVGLKSMKGFPEYVEEDFSIMNNELSSLEYCPKIVNGDFNCMYNAKQFTSSEVRQVCEVKGIVFV